MGLIDVLNGMSHGPRGPRGPATGGTGGGMSPITIAVLGLLAFKALKSFTSQASTAPASPGAPAQAPGANPGGGLGDILKSGLGGLLAGGGAGGALSGGLNDLLKQLQQAGQGEVAKSWVGNGPNQPISPNNLAKALGADQVNALAAHSGMSRDDLLDALSQYLPEAVNHLTPDGRLPTEHEISRAL